MINQDVMDLYSRVPDGTRVVVLTETGQFPTSLTMPPPVPATKPKPATPKPAPPAPEPAYLPPPISQTGPRPV